MLNTLLSSTLLQYNLLDKSYFKHKTSIVTSTYVNKEDQQWNIEFEWKQMDRLTIYVLPLYEIHLMIMNWISNLGFVSQMNE